MAASAAARAASARAVTASAFARSASLRAAAAIVSARLMSSLAVASDSRKVWLSSSRSARLRLAAAASASAASSCWRRSLFSVSRSFVWSLCDADAASMRFSMALEYSVAERRRVCVAPRSATRALSSTSLAWSSARRSTTVFCSPPIPAKVCCSARKSASSLRKFSSSISLSCPDETLIEAMRWTF
eukprot:Amastigsp_a340358_16.p2 type:complete len:187 gc:universal Amastigsp_a340358_16:585-1145(+)